MTSNETPPYPTFSAKRRGAATASRRSTATRFKAHALHGTATFTSDGFGEMLHSLRCKPTDNSQRRFSELMRMAKALHRRVWLDLLPDGSTFRLTTMGSGRETLVEGDADKVKEYLTRGVN